MSKVNDETVFWSRVAPEPDGCWIWQGWVDPGGYGRFRLQGETKIVHRFAYELMVAPIPDGLVIDHLCRVRNCVNPYHMDPVTNVVNVMRGKSFAVQNTKATHCPEGHPYSGKNLRIDRWRGWRQCRTCRNNQDRAHYLKNAVRLREESRLRQAKYRAASQAQRSA